MRKSSVLPPPHPYKRIYLWINLKTYISGFKTWMWFLRGPWNAKEQLLRFPGGSGWRGEALNEQSADRQVPTVFFQFSSLLFCLYKESIHWQEKWSESPGSSTHFLAACWEDYIRKLLHWKFSLAVIKLGSLNSLSSLEHHLYCLMAMKHLS